MYVARSLDIVDHTLLQLGATAGGEAPAVSLGELVSRQSTESSSGSGSHHLQPQQLQQQMQNSSYASSMAIADGLKGAQGAGASDPTLMYLPSGASYTSRDGYEGYKGPANGGGSHLEMGGTISYPGE